MLVFLEVRPRDRTASVTGLWQGKWTLRSDAVSGQRIAVRAIPGAPDRGVFGRAQDAQPLAALSAAVRGRSTGARIDFHPADADAATPLPSVDAAAIFTPSWTHERDTGEPIRMEIQRSGQEGLAGGGFSEILRAARAAAADAALVVEEATTAGVPCFTRYSGDRRLVVAFGDPCGEMSPDGATIALSGVWVDVSVTRSRDGAAFMQVLQGGTITNAGAEAAALLTAPACFERIESRELARALAAPGPADSSILDRSCAAPAALQRAPSFTAPGARRLSAKDADTPSPAPITTTLISVTSGGTQAGRESRSPSISADGRYVAFVSYATNLTNDSRAAAPNVFLHDNVTAQTIFVAGGSDSPHVTADGAYVVYRPGNGALTSFSAYNRSTGATTTITTPSPSVDGNIYAISDDIRYVAYQRGSPGPSTVIFDRQTSNTTIVSSTTYVASLVMSPDGRYVAFSIGAGRFLFDSQSGLTTSLGIGNVTLGAFSQDARYLSTSTGVYDITGAKYVVTGFNAAISPNGRYVSYNLTSAASDVYLYDLQVSASARVSVGSGGSAPNAGSGTSSVDNAGDVAYSSSATNLVPTDNNGFDDIFITTGVVPVGGAPASPSGLTAQVTTTGGSSTVVFSWTAPTTGSPATSYVIEAGSAPGLSDQASFSTGSSSTTFTALFLGSGTFYVRVRGVNSVGTGTASNEVTVVAGTPTLAVPGPPSALQVAVTGSTVSLTWQAPTTGGTPTTYVLRASSTAGGAATLANFSTGSTATTFSTTGVGAGTYFVRVAAANTAGIGAESNEVTLIVLGSNACLNAPGAPTIVGFSVTGSTVSLLWSPGTGTATSYVVEAGTATGLSNLANFDTGNDATSLGANGVGAGTYIVRVKGKNACGVSAASNEVTVVVR